jgi:hypothetical protein
MGANDGGQPERTKKEGLGGIKAVLLERALTSFSKDKEMRDLLIGAWDQAFAKKVGLALFGQSLSLECRRVLLDILAFMAHSGCDNPVATTVTEEIDHVLRYATAHKHEKAGCTWWAIATESIENYGGVELLTQAFWEGYLAGLPSARTLEALGDAATLQKLEAMAKDGVFQQGSVNAEFLQRTITILKAALICPSIRSENVNDRLRKAEIVLSAQAGQNR